MAHFLIVGKKLISLEAEEVKHIKEPSFQDLHHDESSVPLGPLLH